MKLLNTQYGADHDPFGCFDQVVDVTNTEDIYNGVLILWGGEDIGTSLYGEHPNKYTHEARPSERDRREMLYIQTAIKRDVPIIGVCRGAQLVCVAAGGKLAQHIDGHGTSHNVTLEDEGGSVIRCNSSHHQMMLPPQDAVILATAAHTSGIDQWNNDIHYPYVTEVAYFPNIRALGIQAHPEWANCPKDFVDYCVRKIKENLL